MQRIYSLLAMPAWLTENAKLIAGAAIAVVLVLALIVGLIKGFTRIGWGAIFWAGACALFYALEKFAHDGNPILKLKPVAGLDPGVQSFVSTLSIALVSVLAALIVYAVLAALLRPKRRRYADEDEDLEDLDLDEDEEHALNGKPRIGIFNRIAGGLVAVVNAALVLAAIACVLLIVFNVTPLRYGALSSVYESRFVDGLWQYVHIHTLDFLFIAILTGLGFAGYRSGIFGGIRNILLTLGIIAAIGVGFWLSFSGFATGNEKFSFIVKISDYFSGLFGGSLSEKVAAVLGKLVCGLILSVVLCIAVALVGLLLKLLSKAVKKVAALRIVDGILCTILTLALGAVICALIAAVLYILEYFGIFESSALFEAASSFTRGLYDTMDEYLRPLLEKLSEMFP